MPWVLAATLLGLALRCIGVTSTPLNYDEGATLYFARLPWTDLVGPPARLEPNPPLFYALAHLATAAFGEREWTLRLPSMIAGVLCIPAAAMLVRGPGQAIAAFLVATSAVGVLSSQDARAYSGLTLALLITAAALRTLVGAHQTHRPTANPAAWTAFILGSVATLYLHNTAILLLAAVNLAALIATPGLHRGFLRRLVLANLLVLAAWAPWLPILLAQLPGGASNAWMGVPNLTTLRYAVLAMLGQPWLSHPQPWIDAAFLAAAALGVLLARSRLMVALALLLLAGIPAASWAISQTRPIMNGKTLLPLAPVALVFAAIACARLGRPGAILATALIALQLWACREALTNRPDEAIPAIIAILDNQAEPGDRIYIARPELEILLDHYAWPRNRLQPFGPERQPPWFRHRTIPTGDPNPGSRLWVLTRANPALHHEIAASLQPPMLQASDNQVGKGRSRLLELSLFLPPDKAAESR